MAGTDTTPELVILLDEAGTAIGTMDKALVHGPDTPLHLAFSCYGFNPAGELLVTRRALAKVTWPGVWTNTCCGHPGPGESQEEAITRRLRSELGADAVTNLRVVLPDFRYRASAADGIVENEICPVYFAELSGDLDPDPTEVVEWAWVRPEKFAAAVTATPFAFSPWSVTQVEQLGRAGAW
ncbi:isopentenyl-diphosphate Delta-isomerase [Nakamurella silvestris]|nr:isopentenyl-diphosphate Delta-isomerase [Nakamurella silvestris]